jgi:5-methylthioadenosine/S-adenosylhomocysteine deaminase
MTPPRSTEKDPPQDRFEAAYHAGVTDAVSTDPKRELLARAAPTEAIALHGCVLTPSRKIDPGYVVISGSEIVAVQDKKPQDVKVVDTQGVILPGLIDLHGHPEFNVFAAWEPPQQFVNRYSWRGSDIYRQVVRDPQNHLLKTLKPRTQLRYAEVRALVGGVTAIQGASAKGPATNESLVRNVDLSIFGTQVAKAMIDLPSQGSRDLARLNGILASINAGEIKAFYVHVAEGQRSNQRSAREFKALTDLNALTAATVVIHGTAFTPDEFGDMKDAGAKLVWSPQSNLRLYGETTLADEALKRELLVGLGADWLPSGSTSLLAEMKVARRVLQGRGYDLKPTKLVQMVTSDAAKIAGLEDKLGKLDAQRPADVVVLERRVEDPWENVVDADPAWVELVMIDGDLAYGREDWIFSLSDPSHRDRLELRIAWGKQMRVDTSYTALPTAEPQPTLAEIAASLIHEYHPVGPIFA